MCSCVADNELQSANMQTLSE